jgi:hypothetical protein
MFFYMPFAFSLHHGLGFLSQALKNNIANRLFFKKFLEKLFSTVHKLL